MNIVIKLFLEWIFVFVIKLMILPSCMTSVMKIGFSCIVLVIKIELSDLKFYFSVLILVIVVSSSMIVRLTHTI